MSIEDAFISAFAEVKCSSRLILLCNNKLIAVQDPHGFRPLALGRVGDSYVIASETCAVDLLEAEMLRAIEPGEMLVIED
ncbi:amidophosphoribosyltransferase, partial [Oceanidesulfovibrio marinus]